jgi:enoyl-[acyl-carrier protein] reductase I
MGLLSGKKAFIFGVANDRSIAWGIAKAFHAEGAELGFNYLGEALEKRVRPLAESVGATLILPCDVSKDEEIDKLYKDVEKAWGKFDILVHCIAFANRDELSGSFSKISRAGFHLALDISAYSLIAITRPAIPLLNEGASIMALTYYAAEKVIPNYNVMAIAKSALECCVRYLAYDLGAKGIRVNAISAGPIKTLAASAVGGLKSMLKTAGEMTPLRRNVSQDEVGTTATYLASSWSSGVTGEVIYVDAGANIVGMYFDEKKEEVPAPSQKP